MLDPAGGLSVVVLVGAGFWSPVDILAIGLDLDLDLDLNLDIFEVLIVIKVDFGGDGCRRAKAGSDTGFKVVDGRRGRAEAGEAGRAKREWCTVCREGGE